MSVDPSKTKTIDNLGLEPYVRYALDQEYLDKELIHDSRFVPKQTQVDVSSPFYSSEFESMFQTTRRNRGWAEFQMPKGFQNTARSIFTFHVLPNLGSEDSFQMIAGKIRDKVERDREKNKKDQENRRNRGEPEDFEEDMIFDQEEKEAKTLLMLMDYILALDKILIEINSRRNQFQKG